MNRARLNLGLIAGSVLVGVALIAGRHEPVRTTTFSSTTPAPSDIDSALGASQVAQLLKGDPAALVAHGRKPKDIANAPSVLQPAKFETELKVFSELKRKVYLTPLEQGRKSEILNDKDILRGMRARLTKSPTDGAQALAQNAAIDLLLEALKSGDADVAAEVLRAVVADKQVEDASTDAGTRANLAGVKGEVMFQWTAIQPTLASQMPSLLPGPVSEKIWANVVNAQRSNLAESNDLDN